MTEAATLMHITKINPGGMMSTMWEFIARDVEGSTIVFHADHRPALWLCDGLMEDAVQGAREIGVQIPQDFPKGALVAAMDVELIPDGCMGMSMPSVRPVELNVERLRALITKFEEGQ